MNPELVVEGLPAHVRDRAAETLADCRAVLPANQPATVGVYPLAALPGREDWFGDDAKMAQAVELIRTELDGVGGATTGSSASVYVDADVDGHRAFLPNAIAHEYNHLVRKAAFEGDGRLVDRLALEGLAQCFEVEIAGRKPPYAEAIPDETARTLFAEIRPKLESTHPGVRTVVFQGKRDAEVFERWGGYALAYKLVRESDPFETLAWPELVSVDSERFVSESSFLNE